MIEVVENFEDGFGKFQEYTKVDLRVLYDAGFVCAFEDDMKQTAFISMANSEIFKDKEPETHTIRFADVGMSIETVNGKCCVLPWITFAVNAHEDYYEDNFNIIIEADSRYTCSAEGSRRKMDFGISSLYISRAERIPIRKNGLEMLKDMATCPSALLQFNKLEPKPVLTSKVLFFVEILEKAGIDKQEIMSSQPDPFRKIQRFDTIKQVQGGGKGKDLKTKQRFNQVLDDAKLLVTTLDQNKKGVWEIYDGKWTNMKAFTGEMTKYLLYIGYGNKRFTEEQQSLFNDFVLKVGSLPHSIRDMEFLTTQFEKPDCSKSVLLAGYKKAEISETVITFPFEYLGLVMISVDEDPVSRQRYEEYMDELRKACAS